jgi:hypothetical protein
MPPTAVNPSHQAFILARLAEFCQYRGAVARDERDPWEYMRQKLLQIEPELASLKGELLAATTRRIVADLRRGPIDAEAAADFRTLLEKLLSRGDFADAAVHLEAGAGASVVPQIEAVLAKAQPTHAFVEERRPPGERNPAWDKLVDELSRRLELEALSGVLKRKPRTARRRRMVLRRLRRDVAEYCTVVRIPTSAEDTFTPFMLPRMEALVAACLRFLSRHR